MNMRLAGELELAIDRYNDEVKETEYIYWWDVVNEISDWSDDLEVIRTIIAIDCETNKLKSRRAAGL